MVKEHGISPTEAWLMDWAEIGTLVGISNSEQDTSFMLQFERKRNGAPIEITGGLFNGDH